MNEPFDRVIEAMYAQGCRVGPRIGRDLFRFAKCPVCDFRLDLSRSSSQTLSLTCESKCDAINVLHAIGLNGEYAPERWFDLPRPSPQIRVVDDDPAIAALERESYLKDPPADYLRIKADCCTEIAKAHWAGQGYRRKVRRLEARIRKHLAQVDQAGEQ